MDRKDKRNALYRHVFDVKGHTLSQFCKNTGIEHSTASKLLYEFYRIPQIQTFKMIWKGYPDFSPNELYGYKYP